MHLILTGATGLVGSAALHAMLANPAVTRVTILSRRAVPQAAGHAKATVVTHTDYTSYPEALAPSLRGARGVVWALGVSQTAVDGPEYARITREFPTAFARWAAQHLAGGPEPFNLVHVSGAGATQAPGLLTPRFGRVKGEAEHELEDIGRAPGLAVYNARVGAVDPTGQPDIRPFLPQVPATIRATRMVAFPLLRALSPATMSPTEELGRALVALAMGDGGALEGEGVSGFEGRTLDNKRLLSFAGGEPAGE